VAAKPFYVCVLPSAPRAETLRRMSASPTKWSLEAEFIQACSCDYGCPCEFSAPPTRGFCEGTGGYHITKGNFGDLSLDGLHLAFAANWPKAIHEGNGTLVLFIDEKASPEQRKFGDDKRDSLTSQCQTCDVRALCHGGCPKDRFALSRDGDEGQNYLCSGLELFFTHTRPAMRTMAQLLQQSRPPSEVMAITAADDAKRGPYAPCPCGSGQKFRFCHGNSKPQTLFGGINPEMAGMPKRKPVAFITL